VFEVFLLKIFEIFHWLIGVGWWSRIWLQGGCVRLWCPAFGSGDVNPGV
jgi:hypothetical protein